MSVVSSSSFIHSAAGLGPCHLWAVCVIENAWVLETSRSLNPSWHCHFLMVFLKPSAFRPPPRARGDSTCHVGSWWEIWYVKHLAHARCSIHAIMFSLSLPLAELAMCLLFSSISLLFSEWLLVILSYYYSAQVFLFCFDNTYRIQSVPHSIIWHWVAWSCGDPPFLLQHPLSFHRWWDPYMMVWAFYTLAWLNFHFLE